MSVSSTELDSSARRDTLIPNSIAGNTTPRAPISSFDISLLSHQSVYKRDLHEFSVHYSVSTSSWITRIVSYSNDENKRRCLSFSFSNESDARNFGKAFS